MFMLIGSLRALAQICSAANNDELTQVGVRRTTRMMILMSFEPVPRRGLRLGYRRL